MGVWVKAEVMGERQAGDGDEWRRAERMRGENMLENYGGGLKMKPVMKCAEICFRAGMPAVGCRKCDACGGQTAFRL